MEVSLEQITRRVVVDYLGVTAAERFLLVTDTAIDPALADAILQAAVSVGSDPTHVRIDPRSTSGAEPPEPLVGAMVSADVCLCVASRSIYHTSAKGRAQEAGTRGCFNAPANIESWVKGAMVADHWEIRRVAERLAERLRAGRVLRVTSPAGTDITLGRQGREPKAWQTGIVRRPGEISAFPGGEVSFPPVETTANGVIVFERTVTDLGGIADDITITVEDGNAVDIRGGHDADRLRALIDGVPGATNIAELGIGLNPEARISDDIIETKKRIGTAHLALGDNAGGYGGVVESPIHIDGMVFDVTIALDDETIIRDGALLF